MCNGVSNYPFLWSQTAEKGQLSPFSWFSTVWGSNFTCPVFCLMWDIEHAIKSWASKDALKKKKKEPLGISHIRSITWSPPQIRRMVNYRSKIGRLGAQVQRTGMPSCLCGQIWTGTSWCWESANITTWCYANSFRLYSLSHLICFNQILTGLLQITLGVSYLY